MNNKRDTGFQFWHNKHNIARLIFEAFFCEFKNGYDYKTFSTKKFWAGILMLITISNWIHLFTSAETHWVVVLQSKGVPQGVSIAIISALNLLSGWAVKVYKDGKKEGAA